MPEDPRENLREVKYSIGGDFAGILSALDTALLISTYQAGKLVVVRSVAGELQLEFHNFDRPRGIAISGDCIAVGTRREVWFLQNACDLARRQQPEERDACYLTRASQFTDEIQIHEMAWGVDSTTSKDLWIVNTLFSCLCTLSPQFSFVPRWRPSFVTKLTADDRCHLNGLAMVDGQPKYVTALAATDTPGGWRDHKNDGGCLIEVTSGEIIAHGFAMPHSPRVHRDQLWLLNSGTGMFVTADPTSGLVTPIEKLPGFLRGLAMRDRFAFVGLSKIRESQMIARPTNSEQPDQLRCGVGIVDLTSGRNVASLEFTAGIDEIFDVQLVAVGVRNPDIVGPLASAEGRPPVWHLPAERKVKSQLSTNPSNPATPIYHSMSQLQWEPQQSITQWQLERTRTLLNHCFQHVPYYRDLFDRHTIHPDDIQSLGDLKRIPLLERCAVQRNAGALLANQLPLGHRELGHSHTSGTTGIPIQVHRTNIVTNWWLAAFLRDLEWAGIDPRGRLAAIRKVSEGPGAADLMQGIELPNWGTLVDELLVTGPSHLMDVLQDPRVQLNWLARIQPDYIVSYPSNLDRLATLAMETNTRLTNLKAIQAIAEELTVESQAKIESIFGVPVKNSYTCEEAGYIASSCPISDNYHLHSENVLVEVVDSQGNHCGPGESGRVLITTLHNYLMPFVRYEIGDSVELAGAPCRCGRGLPAISRIVGKQRPLLILADGRTKSSHVLAGHLREIGGFNQFQFIQHSPKSVSLRVVPDRNWTSQHAQRVQNMLLEFMEQPGLTVNVESLDRIPPAASGKLQSFLCEISDVNTVRG